MTTMTKKRSVSLAFVVPIALMFGGWLAAGAQAASSPYGGKPWAIPGLIQAEDFDEGGEGVAYHDTEPENKGEPFGGGAYRKSGVDLEPATDAGPCLVVAFLAPGEWFQYTVNVERSGMYAFEARAATIKDKAALRVEIDGSDVGGVVTLPNTGAWNSKFATATRPGIKLTKGKHVVRVLVAGEGFNLEHLRFTAEKSR